MRQLWIPALVLMSTSAFAGVEQDIQQCSVIKDKLDRLICYDNLAAGVRPTAPAPQVTPEQSFGKTQVTATPVAVPQVQKADNFGITKPVGKQLERIELVVSEVKKNPYGHLTVTFTNGQIWKQTDARRFKLKPEQNVFIKKGALGSFLMGTEGRNTTIRVKRLK